MTDTEEKIIVGSQEWCGFPDLGIPAIKARVDSGATTSSIHAFNIHPFKRHGKSWVSFEIHPLQGNRRTTLNCEAEVIDRRMIRSSSGVTEKRYVISTSLSLGYRVWPIELTLTNRDSMGFRMLLGREAMNDRILVDPAATFCHGDLSESDIDHLYGKIEKTHGGLRIALLATNPDLYSNRRIMEAGDERGHEMMFVNIRHCYMKLDATNPEVHYRGGRLLEDLDAVITRIRPSQTFYGCAIARQFESMGVSVVNSAKAIAQSRDKLYSPSAADSERSRDPGHRLYRFADGHEGPDRNGWRRAADRKAPRRRTGPRCRHGRDQESGGIRHQCFQGSSRQPACSGVCQRGAGS